MKRLVFVMLVILVGQALAAQQRFRTGVGVITMNVTVRRNNATAAGLTARDFRLTDYGDWGIN